MEDLVVEAPVDGADHRVVPMAVVVHHRAGEAVLMAEVHLEALLSSKAGVTTTITSGDSNRLVNQETGHQLGELLEHQEVSRADSRVQTQPGRHTMLSTTGNTNNKEDSLDRQLKLQRHSRRHRQHQPLLLLQPLLDNLQQVNQR